MVIASFVCASVPGRVTAQGVNDIFNRGKAWVEQGEYDKAVADFTLALQFIDPNDRINIGIAYNERALVWDCKGEYEKAIADCNRALANYPDFGPAYINRGLAWHNISENDRAIADYNQALRIVDPSDATNVAVIYDQRGNAWSAKKEYEKAIADYNQSLRADPNRAETYHNRGVTWKDLGEYDNAIADFDQALRLAPNDVQTLTNRGVAWEKKGEFARALDDFNQAIQFNPDLADGFFHRGAAWERRGEYCKAVADYKEAIRRDPESDFRYNALAWVQATCPDEQFRDADQAYENASRAYQLNNGRSWIYIDTLAAAYAENRDFETAVEWETKAIGLAEKDKIASSSEVNALRARLELFKAKQPYRR